jgi:hypothetical protein
VAIPPQPSPNIRRITTNFSLAEGVFQTPSNTTVATLPSNQATGPTVLGFDAVPFSVVLSGVPQQAIPTFGQLAQRNNQANPLNVTQNYSNPVVVSLSDRLLFMCVVQTITPGIAIAVEGQATDSNGVVRPGPFLGPGTYKSFQAVLTVPPGSGTISGWVLGMLLLSTG